MYLERFKPILPYVLDSASFSVPAFNKGKEIVFTYFLVVADNAVKKGHVLNIYVRDVFSGKIRELSVEEAILNSGMDMNNSDTDSGTNEDWEKYYFAYLECYEELISGLDIGSQQDIHNKLNELFDKLVEKSPFKKLYYYLRDSDID